VFLKKKIMIKQETGMPQNIVAFRAWGEVTAQDFKEVVLPAIADLVSKIDEINFILILDTSPADFTIGAWLQDAWAGIRDLTKWNRAAIVTGNEMVEKITPVFSALMIGTFKTYSHTQMNEAINWVSSGTS